MKFIYKNIFKFLVGRSELSLGPTYHLYCLHSTLQSKNPMTDIFVRIELAYTHCSFGQFCTPTHTTVSHSSTHFIALRLTKKKKKLNCGKESGFLTKKWNKLDKFTLNSKLKMVHR